MLNTMINGEVTSKQNWTRKEAFEPDFTMASPFIFTFPVINDHDELWNDDPSFRRNGCRWKFALLNGCGNYAPIDVDFKMQHTWEVTQKVLQETAMDNIRNYTGYVESTLLYGKAAKHTAIPLINVYLTIEAGYASYYGASLLLLDEVADKVRQDIGDFIPYVEDQESFYAIPVNMLERYDLEPAEAVRNIFANDLYEQPMMFRPEILGPNFNVFC